MPKWEDTETAARPGMTGVPYDAIPIRGKGVQAFAYYRVPEGVASVGGWPAVVCARGRRQRV
ncbi:hypothetical protein OAG77_00370 [bacterium]|nr:hypothetical protein [Verrucomicrobiota bacterium]MDB4796630.1 hypothetical protein [bacterium]